MKDVSCIKRQNCVVLFSFRFGGGWQALRPGEKLKEQA
jgi:hypothetical protein